ncbi:type II toxin-antitoxin system HicA family toxin [Desulfocucumis palustris]|uniref:type II toxin-antitoxin system HicA family toxin n=1 Tax=Desulfocucumis palustris TaxID=1898651 RepID=UPI000CE9E71B|nr:type II toxin-antitoxin system HicA family toxin [Desulfocucumis palustris]
MKPINKRELIRRLRSFGFEGPFSGDRHSFMRKGQLKLRIPNPHEGDISVPLLKEILRQAGITEESWEN